MYVHNGRQLTDRDTLESLVDHLGLVETLESLAEICRLKADHISHNWQDDPLARAWGKAGDAIERWAGDKRITQLPQ